MKKDFTKTSPDWFQKVGDPAICPANDRPKLGGQAEYSDTSSPLVLKLTRSKSGGLHRRFFLRVKLHGKRQFHDIWKDGDPRPMPGIAEMQNAATSMRDALLGKGAHTVQKSDALGKTLSEAFDEYQAHRVGRGKKKQRTADRARAMFDLHVPPHVQQLPATQVDELVIQGVVAGMEMTKTGDRITGEATKDEVQKLLEPVVNRARKLAGIREKLDSEELPRDIKPRVRKIQTQKTREGFLEDVATLLRFAMQRAVTKPDEATGITVDRATGMQQTGRLALLMLSTGMRSEEARSLRWEHIDLDRGTLHHPGEANPETGQPGTKTGADLDLPLTRWQVAILRNQANQGTDWVFPGKTATGAGFEGDGGLRTFFKQLDKQHGLKLTPHQLRKVFSTFARKVCGVPSATVDTLTNHAPQSITEDHYIDGDFGVDIDLLRPHVDAIVNGMQAVLKGSPVEAVRVVPFDAKGADADEYTPWITEHVGKAVS